MLTITLIQYFTQKSTKSSIPYIHISVYDGNITFIQVTTCRGKDEGIAARGVCWVDGCDCIVNVAVTAGFMMDAIPVRAALRAAAVRMDGLSVAVAATVEATNAGETSGMAATGTIVSEEVGLVVVTAAIAADGVATKFAAVVVGTSSVVEVSSLASSAVSSRVCAEVVAKATISSGCCDDTCAEGAGNSGNDSVLGCATTLAVKISVSVAKGVLSTAAASPATRDCTHAYDYKL